MPEGPSILIHTKTLDPLLRNKKIIAATGNANIDMDIIAGKKILAVKSWGKHLLICLPGTGKVNLCPYSRFTVTTLISGS